MCATSVYRVSRRSDLLLRIQVQMAGVPPTGPKSAEDIEKEQEAKLKAKYGNMGAKKKLMPKDHKFFDSADWALSKQGVKTENKQDAFGLEPKLEPTAVRPRRTSHLGEDDP
ncbi:MAG: hypothetical protein FRX49_03802 [Trebouxia sp. A1-2]|nr:MAG: hypothetical protein FRX49_03802 [Trebouxia sp. A1-2]